MKFSRLFKNEVSLITEEDAPLVKFPKKTQDTIEILEVYKNGIFKITEEKWSRCYRFTDVNYSTTTEDEQEHQFTAFCTFLNSMDCDFKLTIGNKNKDMEKVREEIFLKQASDNFNNYRNDYNNIIKDKVVEGRQGIEQEFFITVTIKRKSYQDAKAQFNIIEDNLKKSFRMLGSEITRLSGAERLQALYAYYHLGHEDDFTFDEELLKKKPGDFKNDLANAGIKYNPTGSDFTMDDKFCNTLFIRENGYPTGLSDRFLTDLAALPAHMLISTDVVPIPKDIATVLLNKKYLGIESDIIKQQEIRNRYNNFSTEISYSKRAEKEEMENILDEVRENDANLFYMGCTIVLFADSKEALKATTDTITTIAKRHGVTISPCLYQQRQAFNTALPIGVRQLRTLRSSLTQSVAALLPFNVQEISAKNGNYYGNNQVSKNIIVCNRKDLLNGNGFVFGVPGSGKSFISKFEMGQILLKNKEDEIIIIDPMNEYEDICYAFGGSYVNMSSYTNKYVNPLEVDLEELDVRDSNGIIREKGEFMLGLCEQCKNLPLTAKERSIIDRCLRHIYTEIARSEEKVMPTIGTFYNALLDQPEPEAKEIALTLELFVSGSLNIFNHQTNMHEDNRLTVYGTRDLGPDLAPVAMMVMMESIQKRIIENGRNGKATWLYVDEFHVLLNSEYTARYLQQLWKKVRKQGGLCTGITQNVIDVLQSPISTTMLNNSEFVIVLKQSPKDMDEIADAVGISEAQLRFVDNSPGGTGLIKWKKQVVPFDCQIDKNNNIYKLYNTNIHEKIAEKRKEEELEKQAAERKRKKELAEEKRARMSKEKEEIKEAEEEKTPERIDPEPAPVKEDKSDSESVEKSPKKKHKWGRHKDKRNNTEITKEVEAEESKEDLKKDEEKTSVDKESNSSVNETPVESKEEKKKTKEEVMSSIEKQVEEKLKKQREDTADE